MSQNTTPTSIPVDQEFESRIAKASEVMGLAPSEVEKILASPGFELTKDDPNVIELLSSDEFVPFGDLRRLFCDDNQVPVPKLRMAMGFLRGKKTQDKKSDSVTSLQKEYGIEMTLDDLPLEALLQQYDPNFPNRIHQILISRLGSDSNCIAFKPSTTEVAVAETIGYISDLQQGYPASEAVEVEGEMVRLYPVGKSPNNVVDEDPMYFGRPLKRGRSTANHVNWNDVSLEVRQFIRLLLEEKFIDSNTPRRNVIDLIREGIGNLKQVYPEVALLYREREENDDLPKLRVSLSSASTQKQDPFSMGNRKY